MISFLLTVLSVLKLVARKFLSQIFAVLMFFRSQTFYVLTASLLAFPRTYSTFYLGLRSGDFTGVAVDSLLVLSSEVGASVYRLWQGLQVLNGSLVVSPGLLTGLGLPRFLVSWVGGSPFLTGVLLVAAGLSAPYVFYRVSRRFVVFASSRTPGIVHYVFMTLVFVLLVVVYGLNNGLGLDFVGGVWGSLNRFLVDAAINSSVNGSVNSSL